MHSRRTLAERFKTRFIRGLHAWLTPGSRWLRRAARYQSTTADQIPSSVPSTSAASSSSSDCGAAVCDLGKWLEWWTLRAAATSKQPTTSTTSSTPRHGDAIILVDGRGWRTAKKRRGPHCEEEERTSDRSRAKRIHTHREREKDVLELLWDLNRSTWGARRPVAYKRTPEILSVRKRDTAKEEDADVDDDWTPKVQRSSDTKLYRSVWWGWASGGPRHSVSSLARSPKGAVTLRRPRDARGTRRVRPTLANTKHVAARPPTRPHRQTVVPMSLPHSAGRCSLWYHHAILRETVARRYYFPPRGDQRGNRAGKTIAAGLRNSQRRPQKTKAPSLRSTTVRFLREIIENLPAPDDDPVTLSAVDPSVLWTGCARRRLAAKWVCGGVGVVQT